MPGKRFRRWLIPTGLVAVALVALFAYRWRIESAERRAVELLVRQFNFAEALQRVESDSATVSAEIIRDAMMARRAGEVERARAFLDKVPPTRPVSPDFRLERDLLETQTGGGGGLLAYWLTHIDAGHPRTEEIIEALARGAIASYDFARASFWLRELLERYPENRLGHLLMANLGQSFGNRKEALAALADMVARWPDYQEGALAYADALVVAQQLDAALVQYHRLEEMADDSCRVMRDAALYGQLECALRLRKDELVPRLLDALPSEEKFPAGILTLLAQDDQLHDRHAAAIRRLERALVLNFASPEAHRGLAVSCRAQGDAERSRSELKIADDIDADLAKRNQLLDEMAKQPQSVSLREEAAAICAKWKQTAEALRWYQGALALASTPAEAERVRKRIAELTPSPPPSTASP